MILGSFAILRTATISFIMSVCLSIYAPQCYVPRTLPVLCFSTEMLPALVRAAGHESCCHCAMFGEFSTGSMFGFVEITKYRIQSVSALQEAFNRIMYYIYMFISTYHSVISQIIRTTGTLCFVSVRKIEHCGCVGGYD